MLLGREREQAMLDRLLQNARQGSSSVLSITGEAGIGKSALLAYAQEQADGMNVLRARGVESEAQIPFAGLFEVLRPALGHLDQIPAPQAAALESALALRPAAAGQDRFAIGAGTLSLLAAFAEATPALVLLDDAHWLDGSSADALLFAFRRLVADPVAVVVTVREGETSFLDGAGLETIHLSGLDQAATAELLRRAGEPVSDELASRLQSETAGNPLALLELARDRSWLDSVPLDAPLAARTSVAGAYLQRFRSLPERSQDVLVLAAASDGGEMPALTRAAAALGLSVDDLAAAEAVALITVHDARVEFRHPLARSAIYGDAPAAQRRTAHRALANAMPDTEADQRAWHLALAAFGPDDAAASALEQAGLRARSRSAYEVSSRAFERGALLASGEAERGRLLHAAADAAWLGGLANRAEELVGRARRDAAGDDLLISIEQLRGHIATRRGPVGEAQQILLSAAERAAHADPERAVILLAEAANAGFYAGDATAMRDAASRAAALVLPDASNRTLFFASIAQGISLIFAGQGAAGASAIRDAVELLERSDELRDDAKLLAWAAIGPLWLREADTGQDLAGRALATARRQSAVGVLPFLLTHVAVQQLAATDRWAEAQASFHEAIGLARETGQRTDLAFGLARLSLLDAWQGRSEQSRQHATEALELSRELGLVVSEIGALTALGDLETSLGRPDAALAWFEEQQALLHAHHILDVDISPGPELVDLYLRLGRGQEAAEAAASFERAAAAKAQPWALARAARCRGLLAAEDEFDRYFSAALELHDQTPDAFEAARTRLVYGARLRRERQRIRAREQLRAAIDTFDRRGAVPWSEMARAELAATGETARRRHPASLTELTPQELQIALRIVGGLTTREVAAALFLSPKTIEYHLRNVYRKLAITSRVELAAAMEELR
jgi:DNA-binding CsgD family transcriptional regulator